MTTLCHRPLASAEKLLRSRLTSKCLLWLNSTLRFDRANAELGWSSFGNRPAGGPDCLLLRQQQSQQRLACAAEKSAYESRKDARGVLTLDLLRGDVGGVIPRPGGMKVTIYLVKPRYFSEVLFTVNVPYSFSSTRGLHCTCETRETCEHGRPCSYEHVLT